MTKRILCFLSALLLALLPAWAAADCSHHNEDGVPYPMFPQGYIPPQVGVPGYTGDQCCTNCGAIVIRGSEIPALLPPEEEKNENREDPVPVPAPAEVPVVSVEQPEAPVVPADVPSVSVEQPEIPVQPAQPEAPVVPAEQPQQEQPAQPVTPAVTQDQAPAQPAESKPESQPESKPAELPAPPPEEKKPEQKPANNNQSDPGKKTSGGGGKTQKTERERFSERFPYRRVKMTPDPDFIAEFAGELIWPLPGSPFLEMLGD